VAADDADGGEQTKPTAKSTIAKTQTGGATATEATAGREAPENPRKRGVEEGCGHEETASPVAPPCGGEDVPDVVLPPTKRARVLQEKGAPRKRKKNVDDGNDANIGAGAGAIRAANNENENGPLMKKRRRADPKTAIAVRYVVNSPRRCCAARHMSICPSLRAPKHRWLLLPLFFFSLFVVAYSFFFACSRRRRGKENENGMKLSKPARKASKGAMDKVLSCFLPSIQDQNALILIRFVFSHFCHPRGRIENQPRKANLHYALVGRRLAPAGFLPTCCDASRSTRKHLKHRRILTTTIPSTFFGHDRAIFSFSIYICRVTVFCYCF